MRDRSAEDAPEADGQGVVRTDEAAAEIADTPLLTGDPEWDAVEMSETELF